MKRAILILSIYIVGNVLLLLGIDFKPSIHIIALQILAFGAVYRLLKHPLPQKK